MSLRVLFSVVAGSLLSICGRGEVPDWENLSVLEINREPARAHFMPFSTIEEAKRGVAEESPFFHSLDGTWKFHWVPRPEERPRDFHRRDFDDGAWADLPVPSHWELHGYGTPIYVSAGYPFKIDPPRVTTEPREDWTTHAERNPVGSYRTRFTVPEHWAGRRVIIHFGGVMSAFYLWVNGERVGYSQGSMTPAEFDLTPYLQSGDNLLAVEVYRWSDGSYLEDQDMWRLSGIFRSVHLYSVANARIADFAVRTDLDAAYRDATLRIEPELFAADGSLLEGWTVEARLFDAAGEAVLAKPLTHDAREILNRDYSASILVERTPQRGPRRFGWLEATLENPAKWTAETPNLYRLVLSLKNDDGAVVEAVGSDVGFRALEIRDGQFLVNGSPVRFRGVNRHEHDPSTGHTLTLGQMLEDIRLLKQANVNAVRTAHYPHDPRWYELCDRYGLYVMDEANIETHGLRGYLASDPRWSAAFLDRAVRMAERDKNFPSVVFWSLGNESGYGPNFAAISAWLRDFDPTRPIHYEGAQGVPTDPFTVDVISRFYPRVRKPYLNPGIPDGSLEERAENARWEYLLDHAENEACDRPVLTSEYGHCMGNALGNLREYWEEIYRHPRMLGGFIWDWADQGLWKTAANGERYIAYGGDFGDKPNLKAFCLNGVVFSDRSLNPKYFQLQRVYQPVDIELHGDGRATLRNRHHHLDLAGFTIDWSIHCDGEVVATGTVEPLALAPGEETTIALRLPALESLRPGGEYWIHLAVRLPEGTAWAPRGFAVARGEGLLALETPPPPVVETAGLPPVEVTRWDDLVILSGAGVTASFSRSTGELVDYDRDGRKFRAEGAMSSPRLQLYRAFTDNDKGFGKWLARDWEEAGLKDLSSALESFAVERTPEGGAVVTASIRWSAREGGYLQRVAWTMRGDGTIQVRNRFEPFGTLPDLPRIGLGLVLAPEYDRFHWYGHGPHENYPDRLESTPVGLWRGSVADQYVPYPRPQDTGNKEGVRWLALTDASGRGLLVVADGAPISATALHHSVEDLHQANHTHELPRREEVFLSLDARMSGLGNSSCGPGVLVEYAVPPVAYTLDFSLRPLRGGEDLPITARTLYQ
jgi:beta-galactosidase